MDKRYGEEFKLSGEMHKTPLTDKEKTYIRHASDMMDSRARGDFQKLFDYRTFEFKGRPRDTGYSRKNDGTGTLAS